MAKRIVGIIGIQSRRKTGLLKDFKVLLRAYFFAIKYCRKHRNSVLYLMSLLRDRPVDLGLNGGY